MDGVDADSLLDASRTVTLVVDSDGTIRAARGGFGGFLGLDATEAVGTNVFDRLTPDDADELAVYFLENAGESAETIALPVPFRLRIVDDDEIEHFVDVIATGQQRSPHDWYWVVVLVPVELTTSITRSLELEMAGADRRRVKRMICEELASDNSLYSTRTMLIEIAADGPRDDHGDGRVSTVEVSRSTERQSADIVLDDLRNGWRPWAGVPRGDVGSLIRGELPAATRSELERRNWRRVLVAPVHVQGRLRAAIVLLSRVPDSYPVQVVKQNVARRLLSLVDATALLIERWDEQDHLLGKAFTDPLTGLGNARLLADALAAATDDGALLFVDIDHFKDVNDTYGHLVGDEVLTIAAQRIAESCRDGDVVTRSGGDEFVVLLDGADTAVAGEIGQRILDKVAEPLRVGDGPERVSVSIGLASMHHDDPLEAADQAMLRAKRAGRGRLSMAAPPRPTPDDD